MSTVTRTDLAYLGCYNLSTVEAKFQYQNSFLTNYECLNICQTNNFTFSGTKKGYRNSIIYIGFLFRFFRYLSLEMSATVWDIFKQKNQKALASPHALEIYQKYVVVKKAVPFMEKLVRLIWIIFYRTFIYHFYSLGTSLSIICPSFLYVNQIFTCNLSLESANKPNQININYGNGKTETYIMKNSYLIINSLYENEGIFKLKAVVLGNMFVNPVIKGKLISLSHWIRIDLL